jgi:HSP20 family protein
MSLAPRDPFEALMREPRAGLMSLRDAMNRLLEESFIRPSFEFFAAGRFFPIDIRETEDQQQYVVEASLPGVKPEEIQITAEGGTVTIHGKKKGEEKKEEGTYVRRERYEGEMSRTFSCKSQN